MSILVSVKSAQGGGLVPLISGEDQEPWGKKRQNLIATYSEKNNNTNKNQSL